jgi:hypothetical protein
MMSGAVQWDQLVFLSTILVGVVGGVLSITLWLWRQFSALRQHHDEFRLEVARQHDEFRLEVAKEYVSATNLAAVERRIETALTQLRQDFDRGFERVIDMMSRSLTAAIASVTPKGDK